MVVNEVNGQMPKARRDSAECRLMLKLTLYGAPVTKKNSGQIWINQKTNKPFIAPSKAYKAYEKDCCGRQITAAYKQHIDVPINLKCVYYMPNRRKVDLCNLLGATCDILVKFGVIADDNSKIVQSHDGSRVLTDTANPRVEIEIEEVGR